MESYICGKKNSTIVSVPVHVFVCVYCCCMCLERWAKCVVYRQCNVGMYNFSLVSEGVHEKPVPPALYCGKAEAFLLGITHFRLQ